MRLAPHPVTLRQLQYVVAVADKRSFRRAAEQCHVSQPSLSAQIAAAEEALGVQLFERDRRRVLLTAAGATLVELARRVLRSADELVDGATRLGDPFSGKLRLGIIPTIGPYLLPDLAPALQNAYPRLQQVWVEDKTRNLVAALERGELDAAVLALEADIGDVEYVVLGVLRQGGGRGARAPSNEPRHTHANGGGRNRRHRFAAHGRERREPAQRAARS